MKFRKFFEYIYVMMLSWFLIALFICYALAPMLIGWALLEIIFLHC